MLLLLFAVKLTTTRLTSEIAFNGISHIHIKPTILIRIHVTIIRITSAATTSKPVNINETANIVANDTINDISASFQVFKYCS